MAVVNNVGYNKNFTVKCSKDGSNASGSYVSVYPNPANNILTVEIDEEAAGQLRSYMRQKHVEFGLLIGEKISVYFDDYNNRKADPIKVQEISFKADSEKGKKLGEVLDYDSYSEDRMRAFCQDLLKELDIKKSALQLIDKLTSQDGKDILSKALINSDVSEQYNEPAIKMALEEINIIRKQSARGESPKISRPTERKARKAKIADPKPLNGIKETYVEDYSDMTPGKAKIICMNREVHLNDNITFASLNKNEKTYWANPKIEFLGVNWSIILNDKKNRRLHIFNIPAGTISKNQVKVRNDQPGKMDMDILYDDKAFKDIKSGVEFVQWFAETIQY